MPLKIIVLLNIVKDFQGYMCGADVRMTHCYEFNDFNDEYSNLQYLFDLPTQTGSLS